MKTKNIFMRQCKMQNGTLVTYSWLPEKYAVLNKVVKLKNGDDWTDGWEIINVSSVRVPYEQAAKNSNQHKAMATYKNK